MISEKEKLQIKLEIYKELLDCFPCPKINFLIINSKSDIDMSLFEENLENKVEKIKIKLNAYKKVEKEIRYERYNRNKTNIRNSNKKRKN